MADLTPRTRSESFLNGEDLEPITRREHFYAGRENELPEGHQEPETREEWFIKKYREAGDVTVESLSITENGTYTAPSGKAYSPVVVNVPLPSNAYLLQTIEHESIATFADGTDNFLKSLEVAIEPQQDLHGYDAPWVGGAGKNKLPMTVSDIKSNNTSGTWNGNTYTLNGVTFTILTDSDNNVIGIKANGTANTTSPLMINSNYTMSQGSFVLNGCPSGGGTETARLQFDLGGENPAIDTGSGASFTLSETTTNCRVFIRIGNGYNAQNLVFKPMIRLSSVTDATFAPYSNECLISGWDEVNITVADDLENPTVSNVYTINLNGTRYGGKLDVVNGVLTLTDGFISSYNGETLPSTWISDRDVYAEGTTPTIGAEVCYKLATPQTIQLTPTIIKSLQGDNNFFADSGEVIKLQYWGEVS